MTGAGDSGARPTPTGPWRQRAARLWPWAARLAALAAAVPALAVLYYIFWARLSYPLDLEWMESGVLVTAKRVMDGRAIYAAPSIDFASFCYPPLYPTLLGWAGKVLGLSYTLGRALSVLAFTATLALVLRAALGAARGSDAPAPAAPVERRPSWDAAVYAVVAMGAIAAAFGWTGAWYDLVRIDSLFVALSLGGLYALAVGHRSLGGVILAGVLLGLAYFAKQTAVLFVVAAGLAQLALRARLLPVLVVTVGAVAGLGTLALDRATDGWFWFYVYDLHQSHQTDTKLLWSVAPAHLWRHARWLYLGGALAVLLCGFAAVVRRRLPRAGLLWLLAALAGVAAAVVGRATQWAYDNAYIPGVVFPAVLVAAATAEARGLLASRPTDDPGAGGWRATVLGHEAWLRAACWLPVALVVTQLLATGLPQPRSHVPDARTRRQAQNLVSELRRLGRDGEVLVPYHPYYSVIAGGRGHGHIMNVNDVNYTRRRAEGGLIGDAVRRRERVLRARRGLLRSVRQAVASGRFAWVIHDRSVARWVRQGDRAVLRPSWTYLSQLPGLTTHYRPAWDLAWRQAAPRTLSGNPAAPRFVWRWPRPARPPAGARVVFDFEGRSLSGWTREGTAFGRSTVDGPLWDPRRRRAQGLVSGVGGRRWVSSFHGGDAATGRLVSPPFVLDRPQLWLRVAGGRDAERLAVRLRVAGQVVRQATGHDGEHLRTVRWDVRAWSGQQAVLEVVDAATGGWGHLQLDEVWLVGKRRGSGRGPR